MNRKFLVILFVLSLFQVNVGFAILNSFEYQAKIKKLLQNEENNIDRGLYVILENYLKVLQNPTERVVELPQKNKGNPSNIKTLKSSLIFGLELHYSGDLRGNGDIAGKFFCAHDTERVRIQAELEYKDNVIKPNILAYPIQTQNTHNYAINKNLSNNINAGIAIAGFICRKEIALRTPNPQQEQLYINSIDKEIKRGDEIIKRLALEDLI